MQVIENKACHRCHRLCHRHDAAQVIENKRMSQVSQVSQGVMPHVCAHTRAHTPARMHVRVYPVTPVTSVTYYKKQIVIEDYACDIACDTCDITNQSIGYTLVPVMFLSKKTTAFSFLGAL